MKICDNDKVEKNGPELIQGHLYQHKDGRIWLYVYGNRLVNVESGNGWLSDRGFGGFDNEFTDVTEKYCLQRVK